MNRTYIHYVLFYVLSTKLRASKFSNDLCMHLVVWYVCLMIWPKIVVVEWFDADVVYHVVVGLILGNVIVNMKGHKPTFFWFLENSLSIRVWVSLKLYKFHPLKEGKCYLITIEHLCHLCGHCLSSWNSLCWNMYHLFQIIVK